MTLVARGAILGVLSLFFFACPSRTPPQGAAGGDAAATAPSGAPSIATATTGDGRDGGSDEIQPVYPIEENAPTDPLAEKLCAGLTAMPEKKRAACCGSTPGVVVTAECTRTLSAALRSKAVSIDLASVDACIAAFDKTLDGCDWVGPFAPGPPSECQGFIKGLVAEGKRCRSSLECAGSLRCAGVGPTSAGTCSKAKANSELCGGTVDTLATFVRQTDVNTQHPECAAGRCIKHRCAPPAAENAECQVTHDCQDGLHCLVTGAAPLPKKGERPTGTPKVCTRKPAAKEGEACPGGLCQDGLQCISNKCTARKPTGAECVNDFECRGGCVRSDGGTKGTCGPRCNIR